MTFFRYSLRVKGHSVSGAYCKYLFLIYLSFEALDDA